MFASGSPRPAARARARGSPRHRPVRTSPRSTRRTGQRRSRGPARWPPGGARRTARGARARTRAAAPRSRLLPGHGPPVAITSGGRPRRPFMSQSGGVTNSAPHYAASMEQIGKGDLVKVATAGPVIDGIVFDVPSRSKVVVAVMDRKRGPVIRTVDRQALTDRAEVGPDDRALSLLVRRTPPAVHSAGRGGAAAGARRAGHKRAAMHRTTGK